MPKTKFPQNTSELAQILGLSRATVSYVLNDRWQQNGIKEETAARVQGYIDETGFQPNVASRALRGKISKEVAVLLPSSCLEHQKRGFFRLLDKIENNGLHYVVLPVNIDNFGEMSQQLRTYKVDRIFVIWNSFDDVAKVKWEQLIRSLPDTEWMFYDFRFEHFDKNEFTFDNVGCLGINRLDAYKKVYKYVADCGYEYIYLQDPFRERNMVAYRESLGLKTFDCQVFTDDREGSLLERGEKIGRQLLASPIIPRSAVFINDDLMTAGAIKVLMENGIKIPEELGFISWDGLPESEYFQVPLTTLCIPHTQMIEISERWLLGESGIEKRCRFEPVVRKGKSLRFVG